jgi:hypothetical protein
MARWAWLGLAGGCSEVANGLDPQIGTDSGSPCGEVHPVDLAVVGQVVDRAGAPVEGARVWLEERSWAPGAVLGGATTEPDGSFRIDASDLLLVDACWATGPLYWVVAFDGTAAGETPANLALVQAWVGEVAVADIAGFVID